MIIHNLYNVHYEIASAIFLTVMFIYMHFQYTSKSASSKKFRRLILMVILTTITDVGTAFIITYAKDLPWIVNQFSNTVYFLALVILVYLYIDYIETVIKKRINKINRIINLALFVIYIVIMLSNMLTGWIFMFDNAGNYNHGPLYYSIYLLTLYYLIDGCVIAVLNKDNTNKRQVATLIMFCLMVFIGSMIQVFFLPYTLLNLFFASLAIVVIMFAIETPDYMRLTVAMEQLRQTAEELDIARKDAEDAKNEAESANKAKSAFLASMSHEIRTPINGVLGMNAIIMKETDDQKILEYARNIDSAGNGLLSLINDILDFSKIESGRMDIVPVEYKLSDVLSDAYNMVFIRAKDKGIDLFFENNPTIPNDLHGDEVRVRQIIVNLLTNGIKYTEEGMVMLTADWERIDERNIDLVISVKDTGIGIKKSSIDKLFDAFSRVDQKRNRNIEGTGLGLKITKQFLDLMGGTISVDSVYGAGSVFTVRIPQEVISETTLGDYSKYTHIATDEERVNYNDFKAPNANILVVDDVDINLKVIKGLLKDTEVMIDTANSGQECIDKIQEKTYDIIFLDHMMPNMDGVETLAVMKTMNTVFNPNIPVVMLTANAIQGAKEEYLEAGFTDYLSKPVREDEIKGMMLKYLPKDVIVKDSKSNPSQAEEKVEERFDNVKIELSVSSDKEGAGVGDVEGDSSVEEELDLFPKTDLEKRFKFLDVNTGLQYCMQSEEFYESIVREFRNTSKYEEIQFAYDDADLHNYTVLVHGVKSSAQTIGANKVSEMAKGLEFAAKSEDVEYLKENHYSFMRLYGELLDNLDEVYGGL